MNAKEYINSGIVESYVLGLATDAERQEFERMCAAHPDVAEARDAFERSLERRLLEDAPPPSASLKERILQAVASPASENGLQEEAEATPVRRMNPWKWLAAACFAGLLGVGYWAYTANEKYKNAVARQQAAEQELRQSTAQLQTLQQQADALLKPGMRVVALKGTDVAPQAQTTLFWDTTGTRDVYLMVNNLPQPASDQQYQLWALLNGQPIDLGLLEVKEKRLLVKMKNVQNAQAFAITLERRGRPNTDKPEGQMYVLGNL